MDKDSLIFGMTWDEIQARQLGRQTARLITSEPSKPAASDEDQALLDQHGIKGLKKMGYYGVLDRLGLI